MIKTIPKAKDIIVTKHAHRRFLERFRLYFSKTRITSNYLWENLIIAQVSTGHICHRWRQSPFYVNNVESKYGKTIVIKKLPCYYVCVASPTSKKLIVKTVVPKWYND